MKYEHLQAQARIETPLGPLLLAATSSGLAGAWFEGQAHHPAALNVPTDASHPHIAAAARALEAYFAGPPQPFSLALDAPGTTFQRAVWRALCEIEPGTTRSYGQIAQRIGLPAAVRAVGAAVGRNPLSIIVPCHRVIGRDGSLTGYAGGLARKQALLAHEGARFGPHEAARSGPQDGARLVPDAVAHFDPQESAPDGSPETALS